MADVVGTARETIRRHRLISERDTVLAAVSGGPDSVCMLHVLLSLRDEVGFDVKVAHLDHGFRGEEAREEAEFVEGLAARLGVSCVREEVSVPSFLLSRRMSPQDAARLLRYQFLVKTSKLEYCQRIATAHTADDQAETVLMRVLRGAGPDGLAGIPPKREGIIIRPLLGVWRRDVEEYLAEHDLPSRTDPSNLESKYLRNRVRNELFPVLREYNPSIERSLVNLSTIMTDVAAHLEREAELLLPKALKRAASGQIALDSAELAGYDEALLRSVFRRVFESLRPEFAPLPFQYVEGLVNLLGRGEVGSSVELPGGARARLEHGQVVVSLGSDPSELPTVELDVPGDAVFEEAGIAISARVLDPGEASDSPAGSDAGVVFFDRDAIEGPLVIRPRREGDRFRPFGLEGTKSLKDLFIDAKVPWSLRSAVPLLCDTNSILWVVGIRRSAEAAVTDETRRVLAVRARSLEESTGIREGPSH
jgi:tRNA(Ile)-lysidine synthase